jgi:hypothetical protein
MLHFSFRMEARENGSRGQLAQTSVAVEKLTCEKAAEKRSRQDAL